MRAAILLPYLLLLSAGGGALFRLRGSSRFQAVTGRGVTTARLLWATYLAGCAWLVDNGSAAAWSGGLYLTWLPGWGERPNDWSWSGPLLTLLPALLLALWLGAVGAWWGSLGVQTAGEVARHSARGLLWVAPAALLLFLAGLGAPWPLLAVGALCGPVYLVCRLWRPWYAVEAGEWAFGGMLAAALLFSVALT